MIKIINNQMYLKIETMETLQDVERIKNQLLHLLQYAIGFGDAEQQDLIAITTLSALIKDLSFSPMVTEAISDYYNKHKLEIDIRILEEKARLLELESNCKTK